jgi:hypothetical protein
MGEEVGTMQFRVQKKQIKNDERKKEEKMSIKEKIKNEYKEKRDKEKIRMRKEKNIYG